MGKKISLDRLLVEKGLACDLKTARALVMAGKLVVDDRRIDKPGTPVPADAAIRIKGAPSKYVSRGGEKIEAPLRTFNIDMTGRTILDVGASTGGFTDCVLQSGASRVYAVDVGYGQLAWKLQQDVRVVNLERQNIRDLSPEKLCPAPSLAVIDASFISLKKILPKVISLLTETGELLCLVKPQFEAEREAVEKGGLVRDITVYRNILRDMATTAWQLSLRVKGIMESPITGQKGNREFFILLEKTNAPLPG